MGRRFFVFILSFTQNILLGGFNNGTNQFCKFKRKRDLHIILPVFLVSIIACIDRVNIAYAALTMTEDLPWLTPEIFGAGAGIFSSWVTYF